MGQRTQRIVSEFRIEKGSNRIMAGTLERLIAWFMTEEPLSTKLYSNVWLWLELPRL